MDVEPIPRELLTRETVRRLARRSDAQGLLQLGAHAGLLAVTGLGVWASRGHPWMVGALLLHGIVLVFLFCALHESIHRTAFASHGLNDAVAWVCGLLLILPPEYFRQFHFAHHRFTQDASRDPELAAESMQTLADYLWRVSGIPYWRERVSTTLVHALTGRAREVFVPSERAAPVVREARIYWIVYLILFAVSVYWRRDEALIYWVVPALLGQPFLRLFLLAEHSGCAMSPDMLENTRTTHTVAAVRRLAWRMPYHAEHHCYPSVPFHALPELHVLIGGRVRVQAPGYIAVHRDLLPRGAPRESSSKRVASR
ncbi:MAG TPA: fatty acid desaturase [Steroidobacteraceae bacterium]|nr:fatty acid desaturase [Steroidobacteraceae bacterium]